MKFTQTLQQELVDIIQTAARKDLEMYYKLIMATKEA